MSEQSGVSARARDREAKAPAADAESDGDLLATVSETGAPAATATDTADSTDTDTATGPDTDTDVVVESPADKPQPFVTPGARPIAERGASRAGATDARHTPRSRGQLRARRVQRIVRRVDPWSVLKLCLVLYFCVWLMVMVAVVLLWGVAVGSGTVESIESFIAQFLAFEEFRFNGDQLFQVFALGGLIGVFVATAFSAVVALVFNLIADLTGGVRITVIEEETARRIVNRG
jgi:hypothetical protein